MPPSVRSAPRRSKRRGRHCPSIRELEAAATSRSSAEWTKTTMSTDAPRCSRAHFPLLKGSQLTRHEAALRYAHGHAAGYTSGLRRPPSRLSCAGTDGGRARSRRCAMAKRARGVSVPALAVRSRAPLHASRRAGPRRRPGRPGCAPPWTWPKPSWATNSSDGGQLRPRRPSPGPGRDGRRAGVSMVRMHPADLSLLGDTVRSHAGVIFTADAALDRGRRVDRIRSGLPRRPDRHRSGPGPGGPAGGSRHDGHHVAPACANGSPPPWPRPTPQRVGRSPPWSAWALKWPAWTAPSATSSPWGSARAWTPRWWPPPATGRPLHAAGPAHRHRGRLLRPHQGRPVAGAHRRRLVRPRPGRPGPARSTARARWLSGRLRADRQRAPVRHETCPDRHPAADRACGSWTP